MGKLLKFPELDSYVYRDCQCCGKTMPIPVDLESKWGSEEYLCFTCYLWFQSYDNPDLFNKLLRDVP